MIEILLDEMLAAHEAEQFGEQFVEAADAALCGGVQQDVIDAMATQYSHDYWGA